MKDLTKLYTKADIHSQLRAMGAPRTSIVLMHSAYRLVGNVEGGICGFLDAMIEYFTAEGGLFCVPTHTWGFLSREVTLDLTAPETCLGAISELAAKDPRGIHSQNPTHSMVVFGDRNRAEAFIKDETRITSCTSPDSAYGKLYREGGSVLLVGVAHNKNTYLHCVEEMLNVPNRLSPEAHRTTVKLTTGELVERKLHTHYTDFTSDVSLRFPKYETAFRYHGAIRDGFLGNAPTQLCDARVMKDVMERIRKNSDGKELLADERAIPQTLYR